MGRTVPSWRLVVEAEVQKLRRFGNVLRQEDEIFEDMLDQCKLYASPAGSIASPIKEFPLIISMLFAHHKKLNELEALIKERRAPEVQSSN